MCGDPGPLNPCGPQVVELERTHRLQEIQAKLDPRSETKVRDGGVFRASELLRRRLVHEGALLWKNPGSRLKGTHRHAPGNHPGCKTAASRDL